MLACCVVCRRGSCRHHIRCSFHRSLVACPRTDRTRQQHAGPPAPPYYFSTLPSPLPPPYPSPPSALSSQVRPRLHITLELNWSADRQIHLTCSSPPLLPSPPLTSPCRSADRQIQQLGRTHRTGQACPPEHVLLVTDVCGEKRCVLIVSRAHTHTHTHTHTQQCPPPPPSLCVHSLRTLSMPLSLTHRCCATLCVCVLLLLLCHSLYVCVLLLLAGLCPLLLGVCVPLGH